MRHWIHVSLLEMVSRALLPMGMGWLADSRSEVSVYPDGPEVAEEYPSVVDLVHRVRYLEQRLTSSERRARKLAVELAELRACLDAPFEKRNGLLFRGGFKHKQNVDAVLYFVNAIFPELRRTLPGIRPL
jgi:hypothetical protein